MVKYIFFVIAFISLLFAGSKSLAWISPGEPNNDTVSYDFEGISLEERLYGYFFSRNITVDSTSNIDLYKTVMDWLGTTYRFSGNDKNGIDCSGFTTVLYCNAYDIQLSGGSGDILKQVDTTFRNKGDLKEGDLLFFKIYKGRVSHVGVYLGNNKFAHASTRAGVIISDLEEPYYKKYYFKAGRINQKCH